MGIGALDRCNEGQHIRHAVSHLYIITPPLGEATLSLKSRYRNLRMSPSMQFACLKITFWNAMQPPYILYYKYVIMTLTKEQYLQKPWVFSAWVILAKTT